MTRKAITDWIVPKTELLIPKDTPMFIPIYSIHNDANYYPKPEKFDPERFNDENRKTRHPMTFLPFGGGPRFVILFNLLRKKQIL